MQIQCKINPYDISIHIKLATVTCFHSENVVSNECIGESAY